MPITLVEMAKELAQAAAAVDSYLDEEYRKRVLSDFDDMGMPITESLRVGGKDVDVPRAVLRDQSRFEAEEIVIGIDSDVTLEGRLIEQERSDPVSTITGTARRLSQWRGVYLPDGQGSFDGQLTFKGAVIPLTSFRYFPQQAKLSISTEAGYDITQLLGGAFKITFKGNQAAAGAGTPYPLTCDGNVLLADFPWDPVGYDIFNTMTNGDHFTIDLSHPEATMEGVVAENAPAHYEIVVSLKSGIDPTDSHLNIKCRFLRKPASEGAARINDSLNQSMEV